MKAVIVTLLVFLGARTCSAQETVSPHGVTFTLDPARTAPGTIEIETGTFSGDSFDIPWVFKFTGNSRNFLLQDVEWAFAGGVRGDSFNLIIRRHLYRGDQFVLGVSPRVSFPVGGKLSPGVAVLASYTQGLNGFVVNVEINRTAGVVRKAVYGDYARTLGADGFRNKLAVSGGMMIDSADNILISAGQGLAYRVRPDLEIEVGVRQLDLTRGRRLVILTDVIWNLGRVQ